MLDSLIQSIMMKNEQLIHISRKETLDLVFLIHQIQLKILQIILNL